MEDQPAEAKPAEAVKLAGEKLAVSVEDKLAGEQLAEAMPAEERTASAVEETLAEEKLASASGPLMGSGPGAGRC